MMEACHFKMPAEIARQMIEIARERDVSVGQILRDLIAQEIERAAQGRSPLTPEQRRFEALRVDLMPDVQASESWQALQARLRAKGYEMRLDGNVLALHSYPKGHRTCMASDLGLAHDDLARRMGEAFPGHPARASARPDGALAGASVNAAPASSPAAPYPDPPRPLHEAYAPQPHAPHAADSHAPYAYATEPHAPQPMPGHQPPPSYHEPHHEPHTNTAPGGLHLSDPARASAPPAPASTRPARKPPAPQPAKAALAATGTARSDPRLPPSWLTARTAAE